MNRLQIPPTTCRGNCITGTVTWCMRWMNRVRILFLFCQSWHDEFQNILNRLLSNKYILWCHRFHCTSPRFQKDCLFLGSVCCHQGFFVWRPCCYRRHVGAAGRMHCTDENRDFFIFTNWDLEHCFVIFVSSHKPTVMRAVSNRQVDTLRTTIPRICQSVTVQIPWLALELMHQHLMSFNSSNDHTYVINCLFIKRASGSCLWCSVSCICRMHILVHVHTPVLSVG